MKSLLKILLVLAGLAVALTVALALLVLLLFDPQEYRPLLAESVEKATGRKLTLAGDIGLDLFPCCAVTLERASLGNPPGFPAGEFASVQRAALSVKIWPLITRREVQIGTVRLEGLNADLLVRKDGAANWEFDDGATPAAGPVPGAEGEGAPALAIEGVEVNDGRVSYRDETDASDYLAEKLDLGTGDIDAGQPFDLNLAATLTDRSDGTTGKVELEAQATLAQSLEQLSLAPARLEIDATGPALPAARLVATLGAAKVALSFAQDTIAEFSNFEGDFRLEGLTSLAGDAEGSFTADVARLAFGASTELTMPAISAELTVSGADTPGGSVTSTIDVTGLALDVDKLWASMEALKAEVTGLGGRMLVTGKGRIADAGAELNGTLQLEPMSPRNVLAVLKQPEPKSADPRALTRLGGSARWALGDDALTLEAVDMQLDDTRLTGTLGVRDFDEPATRFDLSLDAIDLDRYLEPDAPAGKPAGQGAATASAEEDIPVDTLRDLRLDGRLRAGKLRFAGIDMSGVDVTLRAADGRVRLDPLRAGLYRGEYRGAVQIDATGDTARVAFEQQVAALQVGEALKALYQNDKLTGALTGRISASGSGNTSDALLRTLSGNLALSLADGAYLGTDLWHEIRVARARLKGEPPPPASASPRTPLEALEIAGDISNGTLRTQRMLADVPFIRVSGAGALDLVGKAMDYRVQAQVLENPTFEDGTTLKDLKGLTIPVTLTGPMDKPKVSVELKQLALGVATQKLTDRLFRKLGGSEEKPAGTEPGTGSAPGENAAPAEQPPAEEKPRDALKRSLRDLLKPRQ